MTAVLWCVPVLVGVWVPAVVEAGARMPGDPVVASDPVPGDLNGDGAARVVVVGDSIMEGAAPSVDEAFRSAGYDVAVDTAVSRSTLAAVDLVRFYTAMGADAVVLMLGANDAGNPVTFGERVRSVLDAATGAPLVMWVTIPEVRDYYPAANQVIRSEVAKREGGSVLEWSPLAATPGVTAGDGLHLTPKGIETMTGFLVSSVVASINAAQLDAGGSSGSDRREEPTARISGGGGESPAGSPDEGAQGGPRPLRRASDSFDSILGPGRLVTAAVIVAAALVCSGLGVAIWALARTGGHKGGT